MLELLPFPVQATITCPSHAELALSLAWTFRDVDRGQADEALTRLADAIPSPASRSPVDELRALALLSRRLPRPRRGLRADADDLLLDSALTGADAHPLLRAVIAVEAANRRGLAVGVVSNGRDHCLAHTRCGEPLLLRLDIGAVVDAHALPQTLTWRCAHETCGQLLDALESRWLDQGRLDLALQAAELRLHLPFDADGVHAAEHRLARVRARLN
jgi:hypothetical protein